MNDDSEKLWEVWEEMAENLDIISPECSEAAAMMRKQAALLREQSKPSKHWTEIEPMTTEEAYQAFVVNRQSVQAKGAQGDAVGEIDWGEDGAFAEFYPDRDLPLGAKLYTAPRASVPDGWKLVPIEPTEAMLRVNDVRPLTLGDPANSRVQEWRAALYKAMVASAPYDGAE